MVQKVSRSGSKPRAFPPKELMWRMNCRFIGWKEKIPLKPGMSRMGRKASSAMERTWARMVALLAKEKEAQQLLLGREDVSGIWL